MKVDHELKSWVGLFQPIFQGEKTHDLRVMDRDFKVGDVCRLREYEPVTREYTGREATVQVTYITSSRHQACAFSPFALHSGMACLSIRLITEEEMSSIQGCDDRPAIKAYRVVAGGQRPFVAGFTVAGQKILTTAPILKFMAGGSLGRFLDYAASKGWKVEELC